jgi:hypothetical protein
VKFITATKAQRNTSWGRARHGGAGTRNRGAGRWHSDAEGPERRQGQEALGGRQCAEDGPGEEEAARAPSPPSSVSLLSALPNSLSLSLSLCVCVLSPYPPPSLHIPRFPTLACPLFCLVMRVAGAGWSSKALIPRLVQETQIRADLMAVLKEQSKTQADAVWHAKAETRCADLPTKRDLPFRRLRRRAARPAWATARLERIASGWRSPHPLCWCWWWWRPW